MIKSAFKTPSVLCFKLCVGCGACVGLDPSQRSRMVRCKSGIFPVFDSGVLFSEEAWEACPGKGVDYPDLYIRHYGKLPNDWRIGFYLKCGIGFASDPFVRGKGASGGVLTATLIYLLETGRIHAAILAKQGAPKPEEASWVIARTREEILACAQSVYIPVSMLDSLRELVPGERYAITCVPEQSAALRVLQHLGNENACRISYVLGPYTGTAIEPVAIRSLLRSHGICDEDEIISLQWRAGEWPGYLEVRTASGKIVRSKKIYYNYLIPFFITRTSLQSMDFANEFADLSVGDAWSPKYESLGKGFSVIAVRNSKMLEIIEEMRSLELLEFEEADSLEASSMHGHMIDFKKRGGYLRNRWRKITGRAAPDYGVRPVPLGLSRVFTEIIISSIFCVCRTSFARWCMERVPERFLGPFFNRLRLAWKGLSKPVKRKGLRELRMVCYEPSWRKKQ